jgi:excisionase family DNA binding protein
MSALEHGWRELIVDVVREEVRRVLGEATQSDEYLTTAEAAEVAKVAQGTIRRWIRDGRLTPHHAGRELRVRRLDLDALMHDGGRRDRERTPEELAEDFVRRRHG